MAKHHYQRRGIFLLLLLYDSYSCSCSETSRSSISSRASSCDPRQVSRSQLTAHTYGSSQVHLQSIQSMAVQLSAVQPPTDPNPGAPLWHCEFVIAYNVEMHWSAACRAGLGAWAVGTTNHIGSTHVRTTVSRHGAPLAVAFGALLPLRAGLSNLAARPASQSLVPPQIIHVPATTCSLALNGAFPPSSQCESDARLTGLFPLPVCRGGVPVA